MKTITGDLWTFEGWKIIPTNCSHNSLGQAVMGRGVAAQAAMKHRGLRNALGKKLKNTDRAPYIHVFSEWQVICLPVKRKWLDKADMGLIRAGLRRLTELADELSAPIYIPLLGCGFGELSEDQVLPFMEEYLDDRFVLVKRASFVEKKYPSSFVPSIRVDRSLL